VTFQLRVADEYESRLFTDQGVGRRVSYEVEFLGYQVDGREFAFDHVPYEDDRFAWAADFFIHHFAGNPTRILVRVRGDRDGDGERVAVRREELRHIDSTTIVGPIWCPVANMGVERPYGPGGSEIKRGSRHFAPGAKLYCDRYLWGDGYEKIQVVGHHRASHRYVTMVVSSSWLTNWRLELAYSPHVIREFWPRWDGTVDGRQRAQETVDMMRVREAAGRRP
jgi:hypothetical protein